MYSHYAFGSPRRSKGGASPPTMVSLNSEATPQAMQWNKDDLANLHKTLTSLIALDVPGPSGDLQDRITKLSTDLKVVVGECKSLAKKGMVKRFLKSKYYQERIQNLKSSISSYIQDFTVRKLSC
ncbi:hypothetical protein B0H13DRAFT_1854775 [Mycena leptocephala]|nr:hypothetical protein B0H13DRAFT_1854775 [Mycena leptocephala]